MTATDEYYVDLPAPLKTKITAFNVACDDHAFIGAKDPAEHAAIVEYWRYTRYDLERTIHEFLKAAEAKTPPKKRKSK